MYTYIFNPAFSSFRFALSLALSLSSSSIFSPSLFFFFLDDCIEVERRSRKTLRMGFGGLGVRISEETGRGFVQFVGTESSRV